MTGVALTTLDGCSAAVLCWRRHGRMHATVVVRVTCALVPSAAMAVMAPEPIVRPGVGPPGSPHDHVPFRKHVDVWAGGHVHPTPGYPALVRLVVYRNGAMEIDKTALIEARAHAGGPVPLDELGPRARALPFDVTEPVVAVPDAVDLEQLQWAPADQRLHELHGDEWVAVSGLDVEPTSFASQLPLLSAAARAYHRPPASGFDDVPLVADGLELELDRRRCSVIWRGTHVCGPGTTPEGRHFVAGVSVGGWPIAWVAPGAVDGAVAVPVAPLAATAADPPSSGVPDPLAATLAEPSAPNRALGGRAARSKWPERAAVQIKPHVGALDVDPLGRTFESAPRRSHPAATVIVEVASGTLDVSAAMEPLRTMPFPEVGPPAVEASGARAPRAQTVALPVTLDEVRSPEEAALPATPFEPPPTQRAAAARPRTLPGTEAVAPSLASALPFKRERVGTGTYDLSGIAELVSAPTPFTAPATLRPPTGEGAIPVASFAGPATPRLSTAGEGDGPPTPFTAPATPCPPTGGEGDMSSRSFAAPATPRPPTSRSVDAPVTLSTPSIAAALDAMPFHDDAGSEPAAGALGAAYLAALEALDRHPT